MLGKLKQEDTRGMASMAIILGAAATAGVIALSFRVNQQDRKIAELQKLCELNAGVTLNLVNATARAQAPIQ